MFTAVLLSTSIASGASQGTALLFQIEARHAASTAPAQTAKIMSARLRAASVAAAVRSLPGGRIQVVVKGPAPAFLPKLLTAPGVVTFRITPHGDTYRATGKRAIRSATLTEDQLGNPAILFYTSDPALFHRFTLSHLGERLGIFLDDRLLSDPEIDGPIAGEGMIVVTKPNLNELQLIAAVIGADPLPAPVTFISKKNVTPGKR